MSIIQNFVVYDEIVVFVTTSATNKSTSEYFTTAQLNSPKPKRLVINSGVVIGSTSTSSPALTVSGSFTAIFTLENRGSIQGAGGTQQSAINGGNALLVQTPDNNSKVFINNQGTIYAGGGAGGNGTTSSATTTPITGLSLTTNAPSLGGKGRGYNQTNTNFEIGDLSTRSYQITFTNSTVRTIHRFPPRSTINITNDFVYTQEMFFSSGSNITINQNSAGIGNINTDGCIYYRGTNTGICGFTPRSLGGVSISGSNSSLTFNLNSSGVYRLIKDSSQSFSGPVGGSNYTPDTIYEVINQSGLTDQTDGQVTISNTARQMPVPNSSSGSGAGGDWGQNGSNGTSSNGGSAGSYIVNDSNVFWVNVGTVAGNIS